MGTRSQPSCFYLAAVIFSLAFAVHGAPARQVLRGHVPGAALRLAPVGRLPATQRLNLTLSLPLTNQQELAAFLRQVSDPTSPNYRHYLTPAQFAQRFGPSAGDYQAVIDFAKAHGLAVTGTHSNRVILDVQGAVADIESTFHVTMRTYRHPMQQRQFYAPDTEPSLDLAVPILHVGGLDNYSPPQPRVRVKPAAAAGSAAPNAGSGPNGAYMGDDFRTAYTPGTALTGSGQTVGLLQFDGYAASDITYYESVTGRPNVTLTNVLLDNFSGTPSGTNGQTECSLDIEMVISMAPGVSSIIVYEGGPSGSWHDILNRMATDNLAKQLSCSWYSAGEPEDPVADQIFQQMAAQGQSFFSASGDSDAFTGLIPFPGDTPYITEVGGSTLATSGSNGPWSSEAVWNWDDGTGSGGGISTQYAIPYWQQGISMANNQGSTTMRNVPDVGLTADNVYVRANGSDHNVGGTSCAAPLWAGFTALVNQQAVANGRATVGFLNPAVAVICTGTGYTADFHDITTGNDFSSGSPSQFSAAPGYDLCTGWGTPAGMPLINALANASDPLQASFASFNAAGFQGGPFSSGTATYSLVNLGSTPIAWTAGATQSWLGLSASSGTLAASGSATVTATLTSAANSLAVGSYADTITFTDPATGFIQTRAAALAISASSAVLSVTPSTAYTPSGVAGGPFSPASAGYTVANTGDLPMNWAVSNTSNWLSISPASGTLASGSSASVTASVTSAANNLAAGSHGDTMTFTNVTSGSGSSAVAATLTVAAPAPVITSSSSATCTLGQALSYQITAANGPTFYGASGLPSGLRVSGRTGLISGTPRASGMTTATIAASNSTGTGTASLKIIVNPPAPVITSGTSASATTGAAFSYQITASNGPTSFAATGLPAGLSVDAVSGLISGTMNATAPVSVAISAGNAGGTGTATLAITVVAANTIPALPPWGLAALGMLLFAAASCSLRAGRGSR